MDDLTRRSLIRSSAVGAVAAPLLVACGDDKKAGGTGGTGGTGSSSGDVLAKTSDIPVGEAKFIDSPSVVITQPTAGDFHAFDRTCTHSQCPVSDIQDGKIDPSFVITHRAPLEQAPELYKTFRNKEDNCIKVVMHPHDMAS